MKYRYFKGNLSQEPLQSLEQTWSANRKVRNQKLKTIFETIPFYDGWFGDEQSVYGIMIKQNNPELDNVRAEKGYKVECNDGNYFRVTPDRRYKKGKALEAKILSMRNILTSYPGFNKFMLKALNLNHWAFEPTCAYVSVCGSYSGIFVVQIPSKSEKDGDKFPMIPDFLTEIKHSEFLAIQGD